MSQRRARRFSAVVLAVVGVLALLLLGYTPSAAAQAQVGTGQIVGTVYDAQGKTVPQTKVTLLNKGTGLTQDTSSSDEGIYKFLALPVGQYSVTFTQKGFKTSKVDVEVTVGAAVTVNATLVVGEVTQVVEVVATPLIEATQPAASSLIGVRAISELPINGGRFQDFVTLTPTTQVDPQRGGISFAGAREINGSINIDGADYYEPFFGGIRGGERSNNYPTIPQEAISQFQVVNSGYSVEFGRSTAGVLNATTKSGSNELHGSAFFTARHGALAANDAFNRSAITALYQEGGSVGGRLIKDKLFFFAAFTNQKNDNPHVVIFHRLDGYVPTAAQMEAYNYYQGFQRTSSSAPAGLPYTQTNDGIIGFGRMDYQINSKHRLTGSYHYSKNTALNAVSTGDAIQPETNRALENNGTEGDRTNTVVGQWTAIWTPSVVMEARGQYSLENRPRLSNSTLPQINTTIGITGAREFLPTTLDDYRIQFADNLTWTRGKHSFKFGGEYNFVHASQFFQFNQFGVFTVSSSALDNTDTLRSNTVLNLLSVGPGTSGGPGHRFDLNTPGITSGTNVTYRINIGNGLVDMGMKQIAFFVQDEWRLTPRFTLTAGFRWEGYLNPQPDVSNTSFYNQVKNFPFPIGLKVDPAVILNNLNQPMPRLGIAWDPRGDAKTVIRANAGLFYASTPLIIMAGPLNNFRATPGDLSVQLPLALPTGYVCTPIFTGDLCNTVYDQMRRIGIDLDTLALNKLPTLKPADITAIATALGLTAPNPFAGAAPIAMANDYQSPRSFQWSVGGEREIKHGWSAGVEYISINTVHLERNRNLNLPAPVVCGTSPSTTPCKSGSAGVDLSLRPCFGVTNTSSCNQARPIPGLSDVTIRATDARAFYHATTFRTNYRHGRYLFQAFYTLGYSRSDNDNERTATGFDEDNAFNFKPEYSWSRMDVRHQFLVNGLVDLPLGFTISTLGRFRSGRPMEPLTGGDSNGDNTNFPDRAFSAPGVSFLRNSFRDRRNFNVDMRVEKKFRLPKESMNVLLTAEFFNLFNFANIVYVGSTPSPSNPQDTYGLGVNAAGTVLTPNASFQRLHNAVNCATNKGCYDVQNTPGPPFAMQLGVRFLF
jgi:hypothetical protein